MSKRVRETVQVTHRPDAHGESVPQAFRWRGVCYEITTVLGHWREDACWWAGAGLVVPQRDLWRVEAHGGGASGARGCYELVREPEGWRLDRIWD